MEKSKKNLRLCKVGQLERAVNFQPELLASLEDFEFPFFCNV